MKEKSAKPELGRKNRKAWEASIVQTRIEGKDGIRSIDAIVNVAEDNAIAFRSQVIAAIEKFVHVRINFLAGRAAKSTADVGFSLTLIVFNGDRVRAVGEG